MEVGLVTGDTALEETIDDELRGEIALNFVNPLDDGGVAW